MLIPPFVAEVSRYTGAVDDDDRKRLALWRLGVLGPLISARLEHGDRRALFEAAAARTHEMPGGRQVTLSARTVESWFYAYRAGGFEALWPEPRSDRGRSRAITASVADLILRAKREKAPAVGAADRPHARARWRGARG